MVDPSINRNSFHANNVHIWAASLDVPASIWDGFYQSLSSAEKSRAAEYTFSPHRQDFVTARGILRNILARYLGCLPAEVAFEYLPGGKPALVQSEAFPRLEFNLSHSSGLNVVAVTRGLQVGVDIEPLRLLPDMDLIAFYSFSPCEREALSQLPIDERPLGFLRCWTRKEAYLKAVGSGFAIPPDSFDVSLDAENPITLLANRLDPDGISRWSIYTFVPVERFIGALALQAPEITPSFRRWIPTDFT